MVPEIENSRTGNLRTRVILAWMRIMERKKLRPTVFHGERILKKEYLYSQNCVNI